jgi:hypothetical protein
MGATPRPLHLLALGETLADDGIHRGFRDARGNRFAGAVPLSIIDQAVEEGEGSVRPITPNWAAAD